MTTDPLKLAYTHLLAPAGLNEQQLQRTLHSLLGHNIDNGDLYFQSVRHEGWVLEDGIIKEGSYNHHKGVGIRAISGEKTGFAYSDDIQAHLLEQAVSAAKNIAQHGQEKKIQIPHHTLKPHTLYSPHDPLSSLSEDDKITLLRKIDRHARSLDTRISQVMVSLAGSHEIILIVNAQGQLTADIRPMVRLDVRVIAEAQGKREMGYAGGGGRYDYHYFSQDNRDIGFAQEAVRQALVNLDAIPAPAGTLPVVLGPGWPGVLLHEAVGHGLEGDFNRKKSSAFTGRIGERVASPGCTVIDDGSIANRRGSLNIDDEGTPTQRTVLIENGILKGYMQDLLNARLMGMSPTGNGRRESYSSLPLPRMTNTFMLAGPYDPQEIIASVKKGIYAVNFAGGQVDITSGKFVFSANEAYLIENGKITAPIKGATLIGNGPDVLTRVSMIGNDLKLDTGVGNCGKDGQSVPVGVGQPTLKIDSITVGGTS
ncbi:MAG: metalloprotease TldD [Gammaproteobacteria bacterium]|nr:metalloprotease TldD [Gammaproteobacteria bacterium]